MVRGKPLPIYRAFSMNIPLHDKTPRVVLRGRHIIVEEKPDGYHIVLFEDDVPTLLRILRYGGHLAKFHADAFAEHYDAEYNGNVQ